MYHEFLTFGPMLRNVKICHVFKQRPCCKNKEGKLLIILVDSEPAKDLLFLGITYLDIETGSFLVGQRRKRLEGMEVENTCDQRSTARAEIERSKMSAPI